MAKFLPRADTLNQEFAPAYAYGPEHKLAQLAATGISVRPMVGGGGADEEPADRGGLSRQLSRGELLTAIDAAPG